MRRLMIAVVVIALIGLSGNAWYRTLAARQASTASFAQQAVVLLQARPLGGFELSDHSGNPFAAEQLLGHWSMLFFGYTSCPDICPTTMLTLQQVGRQLERQAGPSPRMVLVTVDPARDDAALLGRYVEYFGDGFMGVRGSDGELQALMEQMGAMYQRDEPDANGNYQVAHSGSIFVVNPDGGLHAVFSAPHRTDYIVASLAAMAEHYGTR